MKTSTLILSALLGGVLATASFDGQAASLEQELARLY